MDGELLKEIAVWMTLFKSFAWLFGGLGFIVLTIGAWVWKSGARITILETENVKREAENKALLDKFIAMDKAVSIFPELLDRVEKQLDRLEKKS